MTLLDQNMCLCLYVQQMGLCCRQTLCVGLVCRLIACAHSSLTLYGVLNEIYCLMRYASIMEVPYSVGRPFGMRLEPEGTSSIDTVLPTTVRPSYRHTRSRMHR